MSALLRLLDVEQGVETDRWIGPASGPAAKRAYGGQFVAQSLAAAVPHRLCRPVSANHAHAERVVEPGSFGVEVGHVGGVGGDH